MLSDLRNWLQKYTFNIHTLAFLLMMLSSLGLYFAAQADAIGWIWSLIALFAACNGLVALVK